MSGNETFICIVVIIAIYSLVDNYITKKYK